MDNTRVRIGLHIVQDFFGFFCEFAILTLILICGRADLAAILKYLIACLRSLSLRQCGDPTAS